MDNNALYDLAPKKIGFSMATSYYSSCQKFAFGDTISELVDSVISLRDTDFTLEFVHTFVELLSLTDLKKLEGFILRNKDKIKTFKILQFAASIRLHSQVENYDYTNIENCILDSKDTYLIIKLSCYASETYFYSLQHKIINSKDANLIVEFANQKSIYSIDIGKLYEAIKETNNKYMIAEFEVRILHRKPTLIEKFTHNFDVSM